MGVLSKPMRSDDPPPPIISKARIQGGTSILNLDVAPPKLGNVSVVSWSQNLLSSPTTSLPFLLYSHHRESVNDIRHC